MVPGSGEACSRFGFSTDPGHVLRQSSVVAFRFLDYSWTEMKDHLWALPKLPRRRLDLGQVLLFIRLLTICRQRGLLLS